jgi:hypothetical protein
MNSRLRSIALAALLALSLAFASCGDPAVTSSDQLVGSWRTYYQPQVIYESDQCHGTLSPMASETWEIYWDVTALNAAEVDILMTWFPSNYTITDFACGTSTGIFPEYSPIEHLYGYIDGRRLIVSHNYSGAGGQKVVSGNLLLSARDIQGPFYIDTYFGGAITQSTSISNLQLEKY